MMQCKLDLLYANCLVALTNPQHYPWFTTYNLLNEHLPKPDPNNIVQKLGRNATMGYTTVDFSCRIFRRLDGLSTNES
jgi:hypothetical protein